MLKDYPLRENGYRVIYGESDLPIALTYDEGHTLVVARTKELEYIGGRTQQEKNHLIFSDEGKKKRKQDKKQRASKQSNRKRC